MKAVLKETEEVVAVMGFVGEGVGQVRAICVSPTGGDAKAYPLHALKFEPFTPPEPVEATINGKLPPWRQNKKKS